MDSKLAPIILFVYNRPRHTLQTLESLYNNELANESVLFIYSDGPKANASPPEMAEILNVRNLIRQKQWCGEVRIIESEKNNGLAGSIIRGVTEIINKYGKVIVLEDDLMLSRFFLKYMNMALDRYEPEKRVMHIAGHLFSAGGIRHRHSAFFIQMEDSWGWATWKRAWDKFEHEASGREILRKDAALEKRFNMDDAYPFSKMLEDQMDSQKIDSWAIRWWWTIFKNDGISLFPDKSLVKNIGYGAEGTHTKGNDPFGADAFDKNYSIENYPSEITVNEEYFSRVKEALKILSNNPQKHSPSFSFLFKQYIRKMLGDAIYERVKSIGK